MSVRLPGIVVLICTLAVLACEEARAQQLTLLGVAPEERRDGAATDATRAPALAARLAEMKRLGLLEASVTLDEFVPLYRVSMTMRTDSLEQQLGERRVRLLRVALPRDEYSELYRRIQRIISGFEAVLRGMAETSESGTLEQLDQMEQQYREGVLCPDPARAVTMNPFREIDGLTEQYRGERPSWGLITSRIVRGMVLRIDDTVRTAVAHPVQTAGLVVLCIAFPEVMIAAFVISEVAQTGSAAANIIQGSAENDWNRTLHGWEQVGGVAGDLAVVAGTAAAVRVARGPRARPGPAEEPAAPRPAVEEPAAPNPAHNRTTYQEYVRGLANRAHTSANPEVRPPTPPEVAARPVQPEPPSQIRYSQDSVGPDHLDVEASMRAGGWRGEPIDTVRAPDGRLTSLDNTRLRAANDAGLTEVPVRVHGHEDPLPAAWVERFTVPGQPAPSTFGDALRLRTGAQQTPGFPTNGTSTPPVAR